MLLAVFCHGLLVIPVFLIRVSVGRPQTNLMTQSFEDCIKKNLKRHLYVTASVQHVKGKSKVIPLQARCGPEGG